MARRSKADSDLVLLPLGGMGEIGMNAYAYGLGPENHRKWILVDCGVKFGDELDPGIDVILPDASYLESENASNLLAIFPDARSRGPHWRHVRGCGRACAARFTARRSPPNCSSASSPRRVCSARCRCAWCRWAVARRSAISMSSTSPMTHSIPEPAALAIRTPVGLVLHSGDWKTIRRPPSRR
jgi:ribonuclease J